MKLPNELASVHPSPFIPIEGLGVKANLSYEDVSVKILDRLVKKLRNKKVISVKGLWKNQLIEGSTWEVEVDMKFCYPHLFGVKVRHSV